MRLNLSPKLRSLLFFFLIGWNTILAQGSEAQLINYLEIEDDRFCQGLAELSPDALVLAEQLYRFEQSRQHEPFQAFSPGVQSQQLSGQHKVTSFHLTQSTTLQLPDDLLILSKGDVVIDGNILGQSLESKERDGQHLIIKSEGKIMIRGNIRLGNGQDSQAQQDLLVTYSPRSQNYALGIGYLNATSYGGPTAEYHLAGGLGGSILLRAKEIIIEGHIQPGNGGKSLFYGGAGGAGGSITLLAGNTYNKYDLKAGDGGPGRPGGDGGHAISLWTADASGAYPGHSGAMIGGNGGHALNFFQNGADGADDIGSGDRLGEDGANATPTAGMNTGDDGGDGGDGISTNANGIGGDGGDGRQSNTGVNPGGNGGDGGEGRGGDAPGGGGTGVGGKGGNGGGGITGGRNGGDGGRGGDGFGGNTTTTGPGGNATGGKGGNGGNATGGAGAGNGGNGGKGGNAQGGNGVPAGTATCGTGGFAGTGNPNGSPGNDGNFCINGILPVELIAFKAKVQGEMIDLSWSTATELNNDFFQIEHSRDGITFNTIGKVKGQGTTTESIEYDFLHRQPLSGVNYYRLKQVDFDGAFEYSDIISINLDGGRRGFSIAPNPSISNGSLTLYFEIATKGRLTIYNQLGAKVYQLPVTEAQNQLALNLPDLPAGMYAIELINNQERFIEQLVIQ